jgi:drug/metabolite transporter (DMT)-like permease
MGEAVKGKSNSIGIMLACACGICWGFNGILLTFGQRFGLSAEAESVVGPLGGAIVFLIYLLIKNPRLLLMGKKAAGLMLVIGLSVAGFNLAYPLAVASGIPVAVVSIIGFANTVLMVFLDRLLYGYPIKAYKIICVLAALFGLALVLQVMSAGFALSVGLLWAFVMLCSYAVEYSVQKAVLDMGVDPMTVNFYSLAVSVIVLSAIYISPAALFSNVALTVSSGGLAAVLVILALVFLPNVGAYVTAIKAYDYTSPANISLCVGLDPVTSSLLGFFVLGQTLEIDQIIGIVIIIASITAIGFLDSKNETGMPEHYLLKKFITGEA